MGFEQQPLWANVQMTATACTMTIAAKLLEQESLTGLQKKNNTLSLLNQM